MATAKYVLLIVACIYQSSYTQVYEDFLGNGHHIGVSVTSSDDAGADTSKNTISGFRLVPDLIGASRFLANATFGASYEDIEYVAQVGIKSWIDEQVAMPYENYETANENLHSQIMDEQLALGFSPDSSRRFYYLTFAHYDKMFKTDDALRLRMAQALNQILVVSSADDFFMKRSYGLASYYDILYDGAFGNYRDILGSIAIHPVMGVYLSHMQNRKANPTLGTSPDENFAREIMQLFTIGLNELNLDGTLKLDAHGKKTATYDIIDVQELARVFTGLSGGAWSRRHYFYGTPLNFYTNARPFSYRTPMIMYEEHHDQGTKILVNDDIVPAGQPGLDDINQALDALFYHDNTGPFVCTRLIQHLVKSNPTPAYVKRVALVFNNNGNGIRGDLEAVMRAILTDPEAIDCSWIDDPLGGKLIQPMERFTNLFHAFDLSAATDKFWFRDGGTFGVDLEQSFYASASVFNFFSPDYAESNYVGPAGLVSPEFEILHSVSSINYINLIEKSIKTRPFYNQTANNSFHGAPALNTDDNPILDISDEIALYENNGIHAVLDRLDLILCRGQLNQEAKDIIANTITTYDERYNSYDSEDAVQDALYFVMSSPSYMIRK